MLLWTIFIQSWIWHLHLQLWLILISRTKEEFEKDQTPFTTGADMLNLSLLLWREVVRGFSKEETAGGYYWCKEKQRGGLHSASLNSSWSGLPGFIYVHLFQSKLFVKLKKLQLKSICELVVFLYLVILGPN